ncbi:hypothetical protein BDZ94DRAFT_1320144 [Collybia nuda]|uniref:Uncharacterized protein n=1 Tax=Collybia nuda TaxID=64659 RepID=A0A9P6CM45_9AGAR|nr:hypothetical protein BDZ94DRAFT_1320144 [Collybia nuda]
MESASAPMPRNSSRPSRGGEREKDDKGNFKLKIPPTRTTPYKEKFQVLRERYEEVTKEHDNYQRDLEIANAKILMLQEENDLLIDAINVSSPNLIQLVTPIHKSLESQQLTPDGPPRSTGIDDGHPTPRSSYFMPQPPQTNGSANGRSNGNHHRLEVSDRESFAGEHGPP